MKQLINRLIEWLKRENIPTEKILECIEFITSKEKEPRKSK